MSAGNGSSLLTLKDRLPQKAINAAKYNMTLSIRHPLQVINKTENYNLDIYYRLSNETYGRLRQLSIPIHWTIRAMDFSKPEYFWIIFSGVLLSRVFTFPYDSHSSKWRRLDKKELLRVPFSAIITMLIFSSFSQQIKLTQELIINFALSFAFGFGFDKVFESWNKSPPSKTSENSKKNLS